ncbi:MAG: hypothetical protein MI974_13475 [Chitinophagales bacterium]|nr:hypothetical protein [Chitinophagales bacterium]
MLNLVVWSPKPKLGRLKKAINRSYELFFFNLDANRRLIYELGNLVKDCGFYLANILYEINVNIQGGLLRKKREFDKQYRQSQLQNGSKLDKIDVFSIALNVLNTKPVLRGNTSCLSTTLQTGNPVLVIANHPYAPLDAFSIMSTIHQYRHDYAFMANGVINKYPEINARIIPVDLSEGWLRTSDPNAVKRSQFKCLRTSFKYLEREGKCVLMHPAGSGSKASAWGEEIKDPPWLNGVGFLVRQFTRQGKKLTILPVFVEGHMGNQINSRRYLEAFFSSRTRFSAAIMAALFNSPPTISLCIGDPVTSDEFEGMQDEAITFALREKVYELATELPIAYFSPGKKYRF